MSLEPAVFNNRVKSISEDLALMAFPGLIIVLVISDEFLQKNNKYKNDEEQKIEMRKEHLVQLFIYGSIITATLSSKLGILSWIRVAVKFHPRCLFFSLENQVNRFFIYRLFKGFASIFIHISGFMAMTTAVMLLFVIKENHRQTVYLVIFSVASLMVLFLIILPIVLAMHGGREDNLEQINKSCLKKKKLELENGNPSHENENPAEPNIDAESLVKQLDCLLEFSTGVTEQLFGAMVLSVYEYNKNVANNDEERNDKWSMTLICVGSIIGMFSMLFNALSRKITHFGIEILRIVNLFLLLLTWAPVLTFSNGMLNGMAYLELVPLCLSFLIAGIACFKPFMGYRAGLHEYLHYQQQPIPEELVNKPVSLSFIKLAYAGFVAASGYGGNHKDSDVHKFVTYCVSTALVSGLAWRFVNQEMKINSFFEIVEKVLCFSTLLFLILGVFFSTMFVFAAVPAAKATS